MRVIYCDHPLDDPLIDKAKLPNHCTVFQAEIFALLSATNYLLSRSCSERNPITHFFSDSMASLQALINIYPSSRMVISTIEALNSLASSSSISLHWVKGHSGIKGNELADVAANEGAALESITFEAPVPMCNIKLTAKTWAYENSLSNLSSTPSSNPLHCLIVSLHKKQSSSPLIGKLSTADLHKLTNILSNRAPLYTFLFKIKVKTTTSVLFAT
jgi:ribonuclease HI